MSKGSFSSSEGQQLDVASKELEALIKTLGGEIELLGLLEDYRKIIGALATARDAREVLPTAKSFFASP
ncbi:hypothetical protein ACJJIU_22325 (plasmid) [Microbulbifer sp. CnH-101-E]|uniref:hypothetical protein n=1 Tax=unclassified Microbulbifer TaxID=2619833 RepID=UPI004039FC87